MPHNTRLGEEVRLAVDSTCVVVSETHILSHVKSSPIPLEPAIEALWASIKTYLALLDQCPQTRKGEDIAIPNPSEASDAVTAVIRSADAFMTSIDHAGFVQKKTPTEIVVRSLPVDRAHLVKEIFRHFVHAKNRKYRFESVTVSFRNQLQSLGEGLRVWHADIGQQPSAQDSPVAEDEKASEGSEGLGGYVPADTLSLEQGIRPQRLSEAAGDGKVKTKSAPQGMKDSQGRAVRKLYHRADAKKHCSPQHVKKATRQKMGLPDS